MLIEYILRSRFGVWGDLRRIDRHFGYFFQYDGVVDRLSRIPAPRKRTVIAADRSGHMNGIQFALPESLHDYQTGVALIVLLYLLLRQAAAAGNRAVKVVRVSRSIGRNIPSRLRLANGRGAVRMNETADLRERLVQLQMGSGIR